MILSAARDLFWEKGPDKCTIRDIAKVAGVAPATIIVHFKNKISLLEATLHEDIFTAFSKAIKKISSGKNFHDVAFHIVKSMLYFYDENRELYRILIRDTFFETDCENSTMSFFFEVAIELIEKEKKCGNICSEFDSYLIASAFFSLYIGVLRIFLIDSSLSVNNAAQIFSKILNQYIKGIQA